MEAMATCVNNCGCNGVQHIQDIGSGAKQRPGREDLLKSARRRELDVIVVWRLGIGRPSVRRILAAG